LRFFDYELFSAYFGKPVILELSIAIRGCLPFGGDPTSFLQTMQRGIEGTMLHLQEIVGGPLDMLADLVAMRGAIQKGPQDEHVQRALEKSVSFFHGRLPTLDLKAMVDIRLWIVKGMV
jgi:hypothetical protein